MQKAAFSIQDYRFAKFTLNLANHSENDLEIKFEPSGVYEKEESRFLLEFRAVIFRQGQEENSFVDVTCQGVFSFENVPTFEDIPDYFYRNCIALLFPYLRAYISMVTTQANVPGIILPTYNLSGLEELLRKSTSQK